jgi:ATP-binding cassette, subfamily B, bacterial
MRQRGPAAPSPQLHATSAGREALLSQFEFRWPGGKRSYRGPDMNDRHTFQAFRVFRRRLEGLARPFASILRRIAVGQIMARLRQRSVPVFLQLNAVECGPACLAMILSYYGRKTRVAECRDAFGAGRDGVSAEAVAKAARSYGLRVKAFSLEPSELRYLRLPAIAHWEFNHFVVVDGWSRTRVSIIDPASGRRHLSTKEFEAGFTGVVLTLEPGVHFKASREKRGPVWARYLGSLLQTPAAPGLIGQVVAASVCLLALGLMLPLFTKVIVDRVLPFHQANVMTILGAALAVLVLAHAVAAYLRAILLVYLQVRMDSQMMLGFLEHLLSLPFGFFQQRSNGDLLMRLGSNTMIREALTSQTLCVALDGSLVIGYLAILLVRTACLGLWVLGAGLLQAALLLASSRRLRSLSQSDLQAQAASQSYLTEALSGVVTLKASGTEELALNHWSGLFANELNASLCRGRCSAIVDTVMTTLGRLSPLLLLWVGTMQVLHNALSLGMMLADVALATAFLEPLSSLVSNAQRMQFAAAQLERISDVLGAEPEQRPSLSRLTPRLSGRIELRNASFRYDPHAPFVLHNISLTIEPGQKVALVGPTGSGKSTLAMLLLGLYALTHGEILYDGIPLERMNYRALRGQFGVVLQESFLFAGSVRQNIAFCNPSLPFDKVIEAAKLAGIHEDIARMPMGYETRIAEGGAGLSGGQRQRLSLARAVAGECPILLLDEATSHLDTVTEDLIEHNLSRLACTRIVIAHRLSTVRNADQILVLEAGTLMEAGSHEELLRRGGCYAALSSHQMAYAS